MRDTGALATPDFPKLAAAFRSYLTKTFGVNSSGACQSSLSMDGAVADKKQTEAHTIHRGLKIVETNWAGVASPASSLATPPAASANAPTSLPPAAQAVTDTAKAQVNGQIKQAGQNVLNKLFRH